MENYTIEEEPFANVNLKEMDDTDSVPPEIYFDIWGFLFNFVVVCISLISVLSSIIIIWTLLKFKRLSTSINFMVLQYAICALVCFVVLPLQDLLLYMGMHHLIHGNFFCIISELDSVAAILMHAFAFLLAVHWALVLFSNNLLGKYEKYNKYVVGLVYAIFIVHYAFHVGNCFTQTFYVSYAIMFDIFVGIVVCLVIINIVSFFRKTDQDQSKSKYALVLANIIVFSWAPLILLHFVLYFLLFESWAIIGYLVNAFSRLVFCSPPISVLFAMRGLNSEFKTCSNLLILSMCRRLPQDKDNLVNYESILVENGEDEEN